MKTQTLYFSGMHCENCEKTITRALSGIGVNVKSIHANNQQAVVEYDESIPMSRISSAISDVGYELKESVQPATQRVPGFLDRLKGLLLAYRENPEAFAHERRMVLSSIGTLLFVAIAEYLAYVLFFWKVDSFWKLYGQYIAYLTVAVVATGTAIRHLRAYRGSVSCMSGMMIGMTIGMISSMLIGIVIGATNGMFVGTVFAMAIGMSVGAWVGACCGVMGVMEGMMAGLMGGTMGPMIAVMMFTDRLAIFMPLFFIACLMIFAGLLYMVFKENKARKSEVQPYGFWSFSAINFTVVLIGTFLMVWGPKAAFLIK